MKMKRNKILGTLYGAAYGDSLGAITEFCTREQIKKAFPLGIRNYTTSISNITSEIIPGSVTDDFGSSCYVMDTIIHHRGKFDRKIAIEAILEWSKDEIVFAKYAGQNTKNAMERLKKGIVIDEESKKRHFGRQNTNGGAMKTSPVGLLAQGDYLKAIEYSKCLCWPTHYNSAAVSAACAIACAICESQREDTTLDSIYQRAISGAELARKQLESEGYGTFGPYVDSKIKQAISLGKKASNFEELIEVLNSTIGTGIWVQESIPAVFAIIAGCNGDLMDSIKCAINAGGDTDTIASMIGAILGGLHGVDSIPKEAMDIINQTNQSLRLKEIINDYTNLLLGEEE